MLNADKLLSLVRERAPIIAREPRPRATFRVSAIGHRKINAEHVQAVSVAVSGILKTIQHEVLETLDQEALREQFSGGADLVLLSPLAEGGDRLIARRARAQGYLLGAILPFSVPAYEATFDVGDADTAVAEFRDLMDEAALPRGFGIAVLDGKTITPESKDEAYLDCARMVARSCDVLIAILSGDSWGSLTGIAVREAINSGIPAIIVDPASPTTLAIWIDDLLCTTGDLDSCISTLIQSLLRPRTLKPVDEHESGIGIDDYCGERVTLAVGDDSYLGCTGPYRVKTIAPFWVAWCKGLNRLVEAVAHIGLFIHTSPPPNETMMEMSGLDFSETTAVPFIDIYLRYHRADALASEYAELHRSVQIVIALLGAATIVFATINVPAWRSVLAGTELSCLLLVLAFVWKAHQQAWLDRWLSYRLVAEICRYAKFLLLTGSPSPFGDIGGSSMNVGDERVWVRDHMQFLLREHRLSIPGRERNCNDGTIDSIKTYILQCCLAKQIRYHGSTAAAKRRISQALRKLTLVASLVTIGTVGLKFALSFAIPALLEQYSWLQPSLYIAAILLPAVTGTVLALRAFGEHDVVAKRSEAMVPNLAIERRRVEKSVDLKTLGESMLRVARLLLREVDGWLDIFADKRLE